MTHIELKEKALKREKVKAEYDFLEPEFALLREFLHAFSGRRFSPSLLQAF